MTNWDKIRDEFETKSISMKDLAKKYNVKYSTLRSRKSRENWGEDVATEKESVATDDATKKDRRGAPKGNKNAKGNPGNKNASPPPNNKNAVSHGLFANWLPDDSLEIIRELSQKSPADMIWENILIQYTAIIRAQKIMYVMDANDDISNITSIKLDPMIQDDEGKPVRIEEKREWHMAYQKQESFMNAQSRAISTLSSLIKQYVVMADEDDSRKLELERMAAELEKTKAQAEIIKSEADKLLATGKGFELLQSLVDVVNEDED